MARWGVAYEIRIRFTCKMRHSQHRCSIIIRQKNKGLTPHYEPTICDPVEIPHIVQDLVHQSPSQCGGRWDSGIPQRSTSPELIFRSKWPPPVAYQAAERRRFYPIQNGAVTREESRPSRVVCHPPGCDGVLRLLPPPDTDPLLGLERVSRQRQSVIDRL